MPPPVEPGEAPINIKTVSTISPALENLPSGNVENPAVLAETLLKKAPSQVMFSVSFIKIVPAAIKNRLTVITTF